MSLPVIPRHSMWLPPTLASVRHELVLDDVAFFLRNNMRAQQWDRRVRRMSFVVFVPPSLRHHRVMTSASVLPRVQLCEF